MLYPYKIIDSKMSKREEFKVTEGYQPTHSLFYLKKGGFNIEINGIKQKIGAGDCVILPDYIYFRRSVINPIEFIYVKFCQNQNCHYNFPIPFGKIEFKDKERFLINITNIEKCGERDDAVATAYLEHLLMDILFQAFYEQNPLGTPSNQLSSNDKMVLSAVEFIKTNISKKLLIADICREVCTNASTLNFKFRREFNLSIGQFIISERLKLAKRLLVSTTYGIWQVAEKCGFINVYFFSNFFKKQTGISPLKFRKQNI